MTSIRRTLRVPAAACAVLLCVGPTAARADGAGSDELAEVREQMQILMRQNREMRETIQGLERNVEVARDQARAAEDMARAASSPPPVSREGGPLLSMGAGQSVQFQLLDVSLDVLSSFGFSTATDEELETLQGGEHDPNQRGFTLQQVELSFVGAVDPYMTGEAHLVYFLDREGESRFELEEAFVQSTQLPWGLQEKGFQVTAGHFFTEFGLINPRHPHEWAWQDQPFTLTRFFGGDGMRAPGLRVSWLSPLPWYSEVHVGMQNAKGETMVSFLANDEVFAERPIGGRPFAENTVSGISDLVYLARWVNGWDVSETTSAQIGVSGLLGPNASGSGAQTAIAGGDVKLKWTPLQSDRGWPFVTFQAEFLYRNYEADAFSGCAAPEADAGCDELVALPSDTLRDWGLYAQLLYGFRRGWSVGLRGEYGTGSGDSIGEFDGRLDDPFRADRFRLSPLLVFQPSEFSRLRLQYNYDGVNDSPVDDAHSIWAGIEFLFGAHPAHSY